MAQLLLQSTMKIRSFLALMIVATLLPVILFSTLRLGWKKAAPTSYAMYFHCQTNLVESFRLAFPNDFRYEGKRAIVFEQDDVPDTDALSMCIAAALTYHLAKKA